MKHQLKQAFTNPKFLIGFVLFVLMLLLALIYPAISPFEPLAFISGGYSRPGTYVSVQDVAGSNNAENLKVETVGSSAASLLTKDNITDMKDWLVKFGGLAEGDVRVDDKDALVEQWFAAYDSSMPQKGITSAKKKAYARLDNALRAAGADLILAAENDEGQLEQTRVIGTNEFVAISNIANKVVFPLGTDNFGADVLTKLSASISVSLRIGLLAGVIATLIGLTIGLLAGFVGGWVDNFLTFLTNIFTVIPSFVILILIANALSEAGRGPTVVGTIIGLTGWPWTARSVRSQVLSLRNRDHVNLSKLSGHSMPRIIIQDILPYVASYVVMALILQISSGILAEAQLSMLGLGPSNSTTSTLGIMMMWAQNFQAIQGGSWWAFIPVVLSVAIISFSLNLMNTGLDQVFNPQLRD